MKKNFIFQYKDLKSFEKPQVITTIFVSQVDIDQNELAQEINSFFRNYSLSDLLVVLLPGYASANLRKMFDESKDITFERLPGRSEEYYQQCLIVYEYQHDGSIEHKTGIRPKMEKHFLRLLLRNGSAVIFRTNGGLVESTPDHHFVFPSKKHCDKFIRTGNVLVNSNEIFFLALQLLPHIHGVTTIYCDTSSINILPYVAFEMKRRFDQTFQSITVNSFKSYEVFEKNTNRFSDDSLILISSSTSGNIIDRLIEQKLAEKPQIHVLYFLGQEKYYVRHSESIICNLTYEKDSFENGINAFKTFNTEHECQLCKNFSRPIYIRSDVFLTIQPRVQRVLIGVPQAPKYLNGFMKHYLAGPSGKVVLKTYYKESDANADYEVFIDTIKLFDNIDSRFTNFKDKLTRLINKYIPANTSCLIHLADKGSENLAHLIRNQIKLLDPPPIIKLEKGFEDKIIDTEGCAVIVASSIVLGKDLLHISRNLRKFEKLSIIYFVGILRTVSDSYSQTLKSNLGKGKTEVDERPLYAVEKIFCSVAKTNSTWFKEKCFLEEIIGELDDASNVAAFLNQRLDILRDNKRTIGLDDEVFLRKYDNTRLVLRKNFAFFSNISYAEDQVFQSEVYFTVASIIANLENEEIEAKLSLKQSNYIRNVLCPSNFIRFNDGIIQACLLRTGKPEFFAYDLNDELSLEMKAFLISVIDQYDGEHGEALLEFLLAIGLKKLRLKSQDLKDVLKRAIDCPEEIVSGFAKQIWDTVVDS